MNSDGPLDPTNIKDELLEKIADRTITYGILCLKLWYREDSMNGEKRETFMWKFTSHEDFLSQLETLDRNYDSGYGSQELYGTIVFTDNSWLERGEYDGSEWWEDYSLPTREFVLSMDFSDRF